MNTRPYKSSDRTAVAELCKQTWLLHGANSDLISHDFYVRFDPTEFIDRITADPNYGILVAEDADELAAVLTYEIETSRRYETFPKKLFIIDVVVAEQFRKRGLARQLIEACEQVASDQGATAVTCEIYKFNEISRQLFSGLGYKPGYEVWYKPL